MRTSTDPGLQLTARSLLDSFEYWERAVRSPDFLPHLSQDVRNTQAYMRSPWFNLCRILAKRVVNTSRSRFLAGQLCHSVSLCVGSHLTVFG